MGSASGIEEAADRDATGSATTRMREMLPEGPPIVVLGMHRSGTSLVSRMLDSVGVHMGDDLESNHESLSFQSVNRWLLSEQGASWTRPAPALRAFRDEATVGAVAEAAAGIWSETPHTFGDPGETGAWGWKDPRNTITLPVWASIFPDARVVHVVRSGIDVALSLQRRELRSFKVFRGGVEVLRPPFLRRCFRLWDVYTRAAERLENRVRDFARVRYEDLTADPVRELGGLLDALDVSVPGDALQAAAGRPHPPRERSGWDRVRVRAAFATGAFDERALRRFGYREGRG